MRGQGLKSEQVPSGRLGLLQLSFDPAEIVPLRCAVRTVVMRNGRHPIAVTPTQFIQITGRIPDIVAGMESPFGINEVVQVVLHVDLHAADGDVAPGVAVGEAKQCRGGFVGFRHDGFTADIQGPWMGLARLPALG